MSDVIGLSVAQMRRIEPYFPLFPVVLLADDLRIIPTPSTCRVPMSSA